MPINTPEIYIEEHNVTIGPSGITPHSWPVNWSAIWVGTLAAIAATLLFGLIGMAVGAHQLGKKIVHLSDLGFGGLVFGVAGAFFSFVIGGWIAATIAGLRKAETASLQGSVVWLLAVPLLIALASLGAASFLGSWYGGLAGTPAWASASTVTADPDAAIIARNAALGAVTALFIGLIGSVIGGWMASGEPMSLTYRRAQEELTHSRA